MARCVCLVCLVVYTTTSLPLYLRRGRPPHPPALRHPSYCCLSRPRRRHPPCHTHHPRRLLLRHRHPRRPPLCVITGHSWRVITGEDAHLVLSLFPQTLRVKEVEGVSDTGCQRCVAPAVAASHGLLQIRDGGGPPVSPQPPPSASPPPSPLLAHKLTAALGEPPFCL